MLFFFFSSRRRHTRLTCDWSSDVCSSDLVAPGGGPFSEVSRWRWTRRRRCATIAAMTQPLPDALLALDAEYAEIVSMLDQPAALSRMVATIPAFAGVKMAWVGEPDGDDRIVLGKSVNTQFGLVDRKS